MRTQHLELLSVQPPCWEIQGLENSNDLTWRFRELDAKGGPGPAVTSYQTRTPCIPRRTCPPLDFPSSMLSVLVRPASVTQPVLKVE